MATADEQELINQLTLNKLALVQALLRRKDLTRSGNRENVRAHCISHLNSGKIELDELKALLESLDLWGNQRIRFVRVSEGDLQNLQDEMAVGCAIEKAEFTDIYGQELPLIAEAQVSPISIRYSEENGKRILLLIAGKIQDDWTSIDTLPELSYELVAALLYEYDILDTNIIFRPYLRERRKVISFAEIDLDSGHGIIVAGASIGYDSSSKTLEVEFLNRAVYQYYNVTQSVYSDLMSASSHGSYLDANVKKAGYSYKQIN